MKGLWAFAVTLTALAAACSSPEPTATPTATIEPTATVTAAPIPSPTLTPTAVIAAGPRSLSTPTPTPAAAQAGFTIDASEATDSLPDSISFHLEVSSAEPLVNVELEFGTDPVYSCATREYSSVRLDFEADTEVELDWEWDMRRTDSIAPGTTVWWRWRMEDQEGRPFLSPEQTLDYQDSRFQWRSFVQDNITLYWYEGGDGFGTELAWAIEDGLATLELGRDLVRPIKAFVYPTAADVQGAILFAQQWAGGLAFPSQNVLLITVPPERFEENVSGLVHELTHLLVWEITFNCFSDTPRWLDEGLATYAEGPLAPFLQSALDDAIQEGMLITLRSLSSSFPATDTGASLSYAQSQSLVAYLIGTYGWERMRELLAAFQVGSTQDDALLTVYGRDLSALDREWRASLGLE